MRPEAELLLCSARTRLDAETRARASALLGRNLDWDYLLRLALRQQVMPLLYRQLAETFQDSVPAVFLERLRDHYYLNAARNHLLTEELVEILRLFESSGLPVVPYKGPALAASLYKDVTLRQFSDLDLLVRREDVARSSELLKLRGYRQKHQLTPFQEEAFRKIECEHVFIQDEKGIFLDLHWGIVPKYFSLRLDLEGCWARAEQFPLEGVRALAFRPEDLLLILSVHASKDFWERLVWVCDVAELIRAYPDLDFEATVRLADEAGAHRILSLSLSLAQDLLGANLPAKVAAEINDDPSLNNLASSIKRRLLSDESEAPGVAQFLRPAMALARTRRAGFYLRLALTPTVEDWSFVKLPKPLSFLYYLTRPVRLAKKYLWRS